MVACNAVTPGRGPVLKAKFRWLEINSTSRSMQDTLAFPKWRQRIDHVGAVQLRGYNLVPFNYDKGVLLLASIYTSFV